MKNTLLYLCLLSLLFTLLPLPAMADGISVDAGITPPEKRWIMRTMMRYMARSAETTGMVREMEMYMVNTVLAYGLTRDLTLIMRQPFAAREMRMGSDIMESSGLGDTAFLVKYKIYRKNTRDYTLAISTTTQLTVPTGADEFSPGTSNLRPGLYASLRGDRWAAALNLTYDWRGFSGDNDLGIDPGDEFGADLALAWKISIGDSASMLLTPVLEFTWRDVQMSNRSGVDLANSGEEFLYISPGLKFTRDSFVLEGLLQFPVHQEQNGIQLERDTAAIVGIRYMF